MQPPRARPHSRLPVPTVPDHATSHARPVHVICCSLCLRLLVGRHQVSELCEEILIKQHNLQEVHSTGLNVWCLILQHAWGL